MAATSSGRRSTVILISLCSVNAMRHGTFAALTVCTAVYEYPEKGQRAPSWSDVVGCVDDERDIIRLCLMQAYVQSNLSSFASV
jgi:hypothetical protein